MNKYKKFDQKRASLNALSAYIEKLVDYLLLVVLLSGICLFILWPMICILYKSMQNASADPFLIYRQVFDQYGNSMINSIVTGIGTAVLCTLISAFIAIFVATRRGFMRILCMIILLVVMVSPPFVSSLAYIQLYGKRGWITYRLFKLRCDPYNCFGVILMQSLSFVPLNVLFLNGLLTKIDIGSIRAARDLGARSSVVLHDVVLPLIRPGILVSLLLSFIRSLADFGTPIIIGGRFSTIASEIYLQIVGYSNLEKAAAMNMCLLLPSIAAFFFYRKLMRQTDFLTKGERSRQEILNLKLSDCGVVGAMAVTVSILFFFLMLLQYSCIFLSGFVKITKGKYSFTLQYLDQLLQYDLSSMGRSVEYALIVAVCGTFFAMFFAYYMDRRRIPGRTFFDCLATLPYMIPGTCFGIGYILAFNHSPLKLTGTAVIVILNMLFKQLPTTTKICSAALKQVSVFEERSARDLGGGRMAVLLDVILPGMYPAFLSCFIYNFSSCMTTAGAVLFLISPGRKLAVFRLFDAVYTGDYAIASLIASVIIVIVLIVEGFAYLATGKVVKQSVF